MGMTDGGAPTTLPLSNEQRLERARTAAEQRYAELFEYTPLGICVTTIDGTLVACNPGFARILGFKSIEDAIGVDVGSLYEEATDREQFLEELRRRKWLEYYPARLRRQDGRLVHVITSVVGQFDATGALVEIRGYLLDVTASVEAETALRERQRLFRAVFYGASDAMLILDDHRTVTDANPAAGTLFALPTEQLIGESLNHLFAEAGDALSADWRELIALGETRREHRVNGPAGARIVECSFRALVQEDRHLCIARDITDRRLLEDRLTQAAKIESVGRLAGGIAHDFNNLLTAILGYTELLLGRRLPDDSEREDLEEIQKAGRRASALTQQLLAFGRKQVLQPQELDLNRTVIGLQPMLKRILREDIVLHVNLSPRPAVVTVDPNQIEQAILNLVLNARAAMPVSGTVHVEVAHIALSADEMPGDRRSAAGPHVSLRVVDTGVGISPEVRAHLFEPFFTTKELGKGTGLGLASVHGIVHQSGGFIVVDSPVSGGSIFTLYFPAAAEARPEPLLNHDPAEGRETILLVEDEDSVRVIVGAALRRHGYRVIEAASPRGALEIFAQYSRDIDLLLTDVVMPGMSGPALAQRLVTEKQQLRVLFISGYADAASSPAFTRPNVGFLAKPFQASMLTAAVREVLDRPRSAIAS
jgi:two-component system cell cycle sensor histidine kinase/response regulator CckA